jgi:hypothetical protein
MLFEVWLQPPAAAKGPRAFWVVKVLVGFVWTVKTPAQSLLAVVVRFPAAKAVTDDPLAFSEQASNEPML